MCSDFDANLVFFLANELLCSPLWIASLIGRKEIVKILLRHPEIDVSVKRKSDGMTAFAAASQEGHGDVAKLIHNHNSNA